MNNKMPVWGYRNQMWLHGGPFFVGPPKVRFFFRFSVQFLHCSVSIVTSGLHVRRTLKFIGALDPEKYSNDRDYNTHILLKMGCRSTQQNTLHFLWTLTVCYCGQICPPPDSTLMQLDSTHAFALSCLNVSFFMWRFDPILGHGLSLRRFVTTLIGYKTLCRNPLHEWSARRRELWQHTTLIRDKTSMPPAEFEPTIVASERLQTNDLDRAATGNGISSISTLMVSDHLKLWLQVISLFRFLFFRSALCAHLHVRTSPLSNQLK